MVEAGSWPLIDFTFVPLVSAAPKTQPFPNLPFKVFSGFVEQTFGPNISLATVLLLLLKMPENPKLLSLHACQQHPAEGENKTVTSGWIHSLACAILHPLKDDIETMLHPEEYEHPLFKQKMLTINHSYFFWSSFWFYGYFWLDYCIWTLKMLATIITNNEHHGPIFSDSSAIFWIFFGSLPYMKMHPRPSKCFLMSLPTVRTSPQFFLIFLMFHCHFIWNNLAPTNDTYHPQITARCPSTTCKLCHIITV